MSAEGTGPSRGTIEPGTGTLADLDQTILRRLAEATTVEEFASLWLEIQARSLGGVDGGIVLLDRKEGEAPSPVALWPKNHSDLEGLGSVAARAMNERRGVVTRRDAPPGTAPHSSARQLLAFPILVGQRLHGVAAFEITPRQQAQLLAAMRQLQWGIAWLQNWVLRQSAWPEAHLRHRLTTSMEMAALILEEKDFRSAATAFLTELATRLECDRASIGFLKGKRVKVLALSHSADFTRQMNLIRAIEQAMAESLDQQSILVHPPDAERSGRIVRDHEALARTHGDEAVCTIPFVDDTGAFFGALTLERTRSRPFDRATVDVCDSVAALAGPILDDKRRAGRPWIVAAWASLGTLVRKLTGPRHAGLKAAAAGTAALAIFLFAATGTFRVTAKTTLQGQVRRVAAAPFRGFIQEAGVRAGDVVEKGQLLCRLDDRDLHLERTRWSTEREQYMLEHRKAHAEGDLATMKVLGKKMNQAEAQVALLDEQIARSQIVAPFRGLIVSGDLSQSLGAPVDAGQVLFEIAPLDAYRLMLEVDEWDIRHLKPGQPGALILTSLPGERLPFTVTRITPVSLAEEGRTFFRVEAALEQMSERLRPGMEGYAKVEIERRRLAWIWTHDLIDWIRLRVWSIWP